MRALVAAALLIATTLPAVGASDEEEKLPDLVISEVSYRWVLTKREPWEPDPLNQATLPPFTNQVPVTVNVTNLGNANATNVRVLVAFGVGVTVSANLQIGDVPAGKSVVVTKPVSLPMPQFCFKVDAFNTIPESNEDNNDGGCHLISGVDVVGFT